MNKVFQYSVNAKEGENKVYIKIPWHFGDINISAKGVRPTPHPKDDVTEWEGIAGDGEDIKGKTIYFICSITEFDRKEAKIIMKWNGEEVSPNHQSNVFPIAEGQNILVKLIVEIK